MNEGKRTAIIAGATGLIGTYLLDQLLEQLTYGKVKVLVRKPLEMQHERLEQIVVDFDKLEDHAEALSCDDVFCCLGTTMKKAGSKEKFYKVDFEYPLALGKIARKQGSSRYYLVTAMGADQEASFYYNQVKGKIEEAILGIGFPRLVIFRPSLLLGPRNEKRIGEDAAKFFFKIFGFAFIGPLKKYKGIHAEKVAAAMVREATGGTEGTKIIHSDQMQ